MSAQPTICLETAQETQALIERAFGIELKIKRSIPETLILKFNNPIFCRTAKMFFHEGPPRLHVRVGKTEIKANGAN